MAEQLKMSEGKSAAFAGEKASVRKKHLSRSRTVSAGVRSTQGDELLESTLVNNIEIAEPLTRREAEILRLIVGGKTNKIIAQKLCRSERTVEYHRNRLMRKLNVHTTAGLVKCAIAMGIA